MSLDLVIMIFMLSVYQGIDSMYLDVPSQITSYSHAFACRVEANSFAACSCQAMLPQALLSSALLHPANNPQVAAGL